MGHTPYLYPLPNRPVSNWVDPAFTQTQALQTDPARPVLPFPLYLFCLLFNTPRLTVYTPPACILFYFLCILFPWYVISWHLIFSFFIFVSCILNYPLHFIFLYRYILFISLLTIIRISILCHLIFTCANLRM